MNETCYCHTCGRWFHYMGINSHRAAHRRRAEDCKITYIGEKSPSDEFEAYSIQSISRELLSAFARQSGRRD